MKRSSSPDAIVVGAGGGHGVGLAVAGIADDYGGEATGVAGPRCDRPRHGAVALAIQVAMDVIEQ